MNSEELERSLKTEFESYLTNVLAEMRQEISGFQEKFEAELEKHKSQLDELFREFSTRLESDRELDEGFKETVVEHLRLARDEGARITAEAISEAESMKEEPAPLPADYSAVRDAINEITGQESQAEILKSLVNQAAQFTPRGAFFIIKNDYFVGWRLFGKEEQADEKAIREVFFPVSASTVLGESVRSLTTAEGSYGTFEDDKIYLDKLDFGQPEQMFAVPLVARGRGVAVLYADKGQENENVDVEALETLVRVAGLTVELLAASKNAKEQHSEASPKPEPARASSGFREQTETQPANQQSYAPYAEPQPAGFAYQPAKESSSFSFQQSYQEEPEPQQSDSNDYSFGDTSAQEESQVQEDFQTAYQEPAWSDQTEATQEYAPSFSEEEKPAFYDTNVSENDYSAPSTGSYQFESEQSFEPASNPFEQTTESFDSSQFDSSSYDNQQFDSSPFDSGQSYSAPPADNYSAPQESPFGSYDAGQMQSSYSEPAETVSQPAATPPARSRFSDRNVDLPIDVNEDERRLHNDARRFARLLVSEIKLYNDQKVREGREASDLYERLREAIDRSREMYDKRVQPPVAQKFDYFHYELVNSLAEGDEGRLGESYPGATV